MVPTIHAIATALVTYAIRRYSGAQRRGYIGYTVYGVEMTSERLLNMSKLITVLYFPKNFHTPNTNFWLYAPGCIVIGLV